MKQKTKDNALKRSALRFMSVLAGMLACVVTVLLGSCAEESRNYDNDPEDITYWYNLKTLDVEVSVEDTLQRSDVTFTQQASCINTSEGIEDKFSPYAYLNITLDKKVIEVSSKDKLPIKLVKSYTLSNTPYQSSTEKGADIVKVFEYDDTQIATVKYGYRYKMAIIGKDTLTTPHIEIEDVTYTTHKYQAYSPQINNLETYQIIPEFEITYSDYATSTPKQTYSIEAHPWYFKTITEEPTVVKDVKYEGSYVGCPIEAYKVTETVITNKNTFTNTYQAPLKHSFKAPDLREQSTLDSLFSDTSTGYLDEKVLTTTTTDDGFTIQTKTGSYTSKNKSKNGSTYVESTITYTYEVPTELKTEYGTFTIPAINVSFEELGFYIKETKKTDDEITYQTLNYVAPKMSTCVLDALEEEVILKLHITKPEVVKKDSLYYLKGDDDIYEVEKKIIWSDGSTTTSTYSYTGSHSIEAIDFGEKITTSLNWEANSLSAQKTSTKTEEKKFSSTTKMVAVYTTNTHTASATNGEQTGVFSYKETSPVVVFYDGDTKKEFPARSFKITDLKAKLATTPTEVVKNGKTYSSYEYDHTISYTWDNNPSQKLISNGVLLLEKDNKGEPSYDTKVTWNNNTATIKVTKTIPHSLQDDEIINYETKVTVSLDALTDDKIYADNTSFSATQTLKDTKTSTSTDGYFKITSKTRSYDYLLTNGSKSRTMSTNLKDATVTFDDGTYKKDFNLEFSLGKAESFGSSYSSGEYNVTPHKLKLTATSGDNQKTLSTEGTTDIYVKKPKATYEKSQTWNGNTTTLKVIKTLGSDVTTYKTDFTISMSDLSDGDIYASNTNFKANKSESSNTSSSSTDGHFKITTRTRSYDYTVTNNEKSRTMTTTLKDGEITFDNGEYSATFDVSLSLTEKEELGTATTSGNYLVTPHTLKLTASTVDNKTLSTQGITNIYVEKEEEEPEQPHLGKPKSFVVTATFDPSQKVTRRAFCFNWEDGVTYAVCDYETMLPSSSDFMYQVDDYHDYNSVACTKQGSWVPTRGSDDNDAIRWYSSDGSLVSGIDKAITCKTIGWKNISNGKYALVIEGYTYEINGYTITVTAPNGEKVSFNSHYKK